MHSHNSSLCISTPKCHISRLGQDLWQRMIPNIRKHSQISLPVLRHLHARSPEFCASKSVASGDGSGKDFPLSLLRSAASSDLQESRKGAYQLNCSPTVLAVLNSVSQIHSREAAAAEGKRFRTFPAIYPLCRIFRLSEKPKVRIK